uniref:CCHC-type domain-containing protein n=1 Tax=Strongyloides papillosus TaxID=174720 RepID=A0A0N5C5J6_STREA
MKKYRNRNLDQSTALKFKTVCDVYNSFNPAIPAEDILILGQLTYPRFTTDHTKLVRHCQEVLDLVYTLKFTKSDSPVSDKSNDMHASSRMERFNPMSGKSIEPWIKQLERCMKLDKIVEEEDKINLTLACLPLEITETIDELPTSDFDTYSKLREILLNKYNGQISRQTAFARLRSFKLDINVDKFVSSCQELGEIVKQISPGISKDALLNIQISQLTTHLQPYRSLWTFITSRNNFGSYEELVAELDTNNRLFKASIGKGRGKEGLPPKKSAAPKDKSTITCRKCSQKGHYANECTNKSVGKPVQTNNKSPNEVRAVTSNNSDVAAQLDETNRMMKHLLEMQNYSINKITLDDEGKRMEANVEELTDEETDTIPPPTSNDLGKSAVVNPVSDKTVFDVKSKNPSFPKKSKMQKVQLKESKKNQSPDAIVRNANSNLLFIVPVEMSDGRVYPTLIDSGADVTVIKHSIARRTGANSNLLFIVPVEMSDGRVYPTLIDSGADVTVIKHSIARRTGFVASSADTMKLKLANGENWRTIGKHHTKLRFLNNVYVWVNAIVVEDKDLQNPRYSMIIGSEVIHASEMIIDYKNLSLFVCDRPLKHLSVTKNETKINNVVASMSIVDDFQLKEIEDLKNEFYDVISFDKNRIGLSKLMAPTLKVVDSNLPKLPRYFLPSHQIPIVEEQISQWLNSGTIKEDFYVKYLQNLVCTRKKDGTWRVCLNCKPLNSKLQDYYYPSPTLKQIIPILSNGDWYTCLDLCQFFTQIGLDDESSQYLGFVAPNGKTYKFTRLIYKFCHLEQQNLDI